MKWKKSYVMSIWGNLINTDVIVDELITQLTFDKLNVFTWKPLWFAFCCCFSDMFCLCVVVYFLLLFYVLVGERISLASTMHLVVVLHEYNIQWQLWSSVSMYVALIFAKLLGTRKFRSALPQESGSMIWNDNNILALIHKLETILLFRTAVYWTLES